MRVAEISTATVAAAARVLRRDCRARASSMTPAATPGALGDHTVGREERLIELL